jgi:hypothetical protein
MILEETNMKLDQSFDTALKTPVSISRGSDRFILMSENEYLNLKDALLSLQRNLKSMLDIRSGECATASTPEEIEELINGIFNQSKSKRYK